MQGGLGAVQGTDRCVRWCMSELCERAHCTRNEDAAAASEPAQAAHVARVSWCADCNVAACDARGESWAARVEWRDCHACRGVHAPGVT